MIEPPKAELIPLWEWRCESCGGLNFLRHVQEVTFSSKDEELEMRAELGVNSDAEGVITQLPETVLCEHCLQLHHTF